MKRERDLKRRLTSLDALGEAVKAMKSLSAHHFREMRGRVAPAAAYRRGVEEIAGRVGAALPAGPGGAGLLLIGGELGLCGGYNAELAAAFGQRRREVGPGPNYCVGARAARLVVRHGLVLERSYATPASERSITRLLLELTRDVLSDYVSARLSRIEVVSSRFEGIGVHNPKTTLLLPLVVAPQQCSVRPRYVDQDRLSGVVVRELLYCIVFDLLIEGVAAEHGARLLATEAAEQWIDRACTRLQRQLISARRELSTQEVIEIGGGARASLTRAS